MKRILFILALFCSLSASGQVVKDWFFARDYYRLGDSTVTGWNSGFLPDTNKVNALILGAIDTSIISVDTFYISGQDVWVGNTDTIYKVDSAIYSDTAIYALNAGDSTWVRIDVDSAYIAYIKTGSTVIDSVSVTSDSIIISGSAENHKIYDASNDLFISTENSTHRIIMGDQFAGGIYIDSDSRVTNRAASGGDYATLLVDASGVEPEINMAVEQSGYQLGFDIADSIFVFSIESDTVVKINADSGLVADQIFTDTITAIKGKFDTLQFLDGSYLITVAMFNSDSVQSSDTLKQKIYDKTGVYWDWLTMVEDTTANLVRIDVDSLFAGYIETGSTIIDSTSVSADTTKSENFESEDETLAFRFESKSTLTSGEKIFSLVNGVVGEVLYVDYLGMVDADGGVRLGNVSGGYYTQIQNTQGEFGIYSNGTRRAQINPGETNTPYWFDSHNLITGKLLAVGNQGDTIFKVRSDSGLVVDEIFTDTITAIKGKFDTIVVEGVELYADTDTLKAPTFWAKFKGYIGEIFRGDTLIIGSDTAIGFIDLNEAVGAETFDSIRTTNLSVSGVFNHDYYHAAAYLDEDSTVTTSLTTSWIFLGSGSNNKFTNIVADGFSLDGDTLTFDQDAGDTRDSVKMCVSYSCVSSASDNNKNIFIGIFIKHTGGSYIEYVPVTSSTPTIASGTYYAGPTCTTMPVWLQDGDKIQIRAKCGATTTTLSTKYFKINLGEK